VRAAAALDATQAMRGLETSQDMALSANVDQRADIGSLGRVLLPPGQLARRTTSSSRDQQTPRPPSARADGPAATSRPKVPVKDPNSTRTRVWGPRSRSAPRRGMAAVPEPDGLVGDPLRIESASAMPPMMPGCPAIGKPRAGRRSSGSDSDPVPPSVIGPVDQHTYRHKPPDGARARNLPETLPDAASSHPTTQPSTVPLTRAVVRERAVLHGVMNDPRIDGKDAVRRSALRPGIRSRRRGHSIGHDRRSTTDGSRQVPTQGP
jgi:hypothetical protein